MLVEAKMKVISGCDSKGMLGEFQFIHEHHRGYGHRVRWINPPPSGLKLMLCGEPVTVDEIGKAGMIACTRKSDEVQVLVFPWDFKLPA